MAKAKNKKKLSRLSLNTIPLILIIITLLVGIVIYKKHSLNLSSVIENREQNEDELSMYQMPEDVRNALNNAKASGKTILGAHEGPAFHIPILMYHYVEYVQDKGDKMRISLNTPPEVLEEEIKALIKAGYNFITPSELADILDNIKQPPAKPIILSFDDGYRDFYTYAFPILKKYNAKAVAYIISGFLDDKNYMTKPQIQDIYKSGLVEIGVHTVDHIALQGAAGATAKKEIEKSKLDLEEQIGIPITTFAYPYGSFDLNALNIVRSAGYRTALSTLPGSEVSDQERYFVNRIRPGGRIGQTLLNAL